MSRESFAPNVHAGRAVNVRVPPARIVRGDLRNGLRQPAPPAIPCFEITTNDWNNLSARAMNAHMDAERLSVKELARKIGCSDRTAENYINGRTAPASLHFLRCIAVIPEFEAEVRRVTAMMEDHDPRGMKAAMDLVRAAQAFMAAKAPRPQPTDDAALADLFEEASA